MRCRDEGATVSSRPDVAVAAAYVTSVSGRFPSVPERFTNAPDRSSAVSVAKVVVL